MISRSPTLAILVLVLWSELGPRLPEVEELLVLALVLLLPVLLPLLLGVLLVLPAPASLLSMLCRMPSVQISLLKKSDHASHTNLVG
jgi:hypothetical protein